MTDAPRRFRVVDPDDMTMNDFHLVKMGTGVDLMNPPTEAERLGALLWWGSRQADPPAPISWDDIGAHSLSWIVARCDFGDDDQPGSRPDPTASPSLTESPSPSDGEPHPTASEPAPPPS